MRYVAASMVVDVTFTHTYTKLLQPLRMRRGLIKLNTHGALLLISIRDYLR